MTKVIIVGAVNVDMVISADSLPTPGETVVGEGLKIFGGGKGANAAVAASRAGADVWLIGAVGDDDGGVRALESLRNDGVNVDGVTVLSGHPTGAALIAVDAQGENQIVLGPGANGAVSEGLVSSALARLLQPHDVVQISTEIPYDAVAAAARIANQSKVCWLLNPAPVIPGLWDLLPLGPILTPNEKELGGLVGQGEPSIVFPTSGGVSAFVDILVARTQTPVVATLGAKGCVVGSPGSNEVDRLPVKMEIDVVDTTGAGDTFNGVLAAGLAKGDALRSAVDTAVIAATLSVSSIGAREGMPDQKAIKEALINSN